MKNQITKTLILADPVGRETGRYIKYTETFNTVKYLRLLDSGADDDQGLIDCCTTRAR